MGSDASANTTPKWMFYVGWFLSLAPMLIFAMSMQGKFMPTEEIIESSAKYGYPDGVMGTLGFVELGCVVLYLIPQTSVLGAILITGYLGGAVATHVRVSEPFFIPIVIGVVLWGGLFLRDARIRALMPIKR